MVRGTRDTTCRHKPLTTNIHHSRPLTVTGELVLESLDNHQYYGGPWRPDQLNGGGGESGETGDHNKKFNISHQAIQSSYDVLVGVHPDHVSLAVIRSVHT